MNLKILKHGPIYTAYEQKPTIIRNNKDLKQETTMLLRIYQE